MVWRGLGYGDVVVEDRKSLSFAHKTVAVIAVTAIYSSHHYLLQDPRAGLLDEAASIVPNRLPI